MMKPPRIAGRAPVATRIAAETAGTDVAVREIMRRGLGIDQLASLPEAWRGDQPLDTKPLSARNDVLVFQTPPLASDIEVTGRLIVKLWASSDALDTDFTAKLVDVYPPNADFPSGVDLNIADSIVRAGQGFGSTERHILACERRF